MNGGGSGNNEFVINVLHGTEGSTLDKTYDEVIEALQNGLTPVIYSKASGEQGNLLSTVKYIFSDYRYIPDRQYQFIVFVGFLGNIFPDQTDVWTPALDISILYFMSDNTIHYGGASLTVENDD